MDILWSGRKRTNVRVTQLCQGAIEIADAIGDTFLKSLALTVWCNDSISRTDFIQADQLSRRLIDLSQELGDPRPEGMGRLLLAFTRGYEEQYVEALSHAEELIRLAVNPLDELMGRCAKGAILAFSGSADLALELLESARGDILANGFNHLLPSIEIGHGAALLRSGRMAAGVRWLNDAISRHSQSDNCVVCTFGHLVLGITYLRMVCGEGELSLKAKVRNLPFLIRSMPVARRRCAFHLTSAIELSRRHEVPGQLARALCERGHLELACKSYAAARADFAEAEEIATKHHYENVLRRVAEAYQHDAVREPRWTRDRWLSRETYVAWLASSLGQLVKGWAADTRSSCAGQPDVMTIVRNLACEGRIVIVVLHDLTLTAT